TRASLILVVLGTLAGCGDDSSSQNSRDMGVPVDDMGSGCNVVVDISKSGTVFPVQLIATARGPRGAPNWKVSLLGKSGTEPFMVVDNGSGLKISYTATASGTYTFEVDFGGSCHGSRDVELDGDGTPASCTMRALPPDFSEFTATE